MTLKIKDKNIIHNMLFLHIFFLFPEIPVPTARAGPTQYWPFLETTQTKGTPLVKQQFKSIHK